MAQVKRGTKRIVALAVAGLVALTPADRLWAQSPPPVITGSLGAARLLGPRGAAQLEAWRRKAEVLAGRYPERLLLAGPGRERVMALTFDDGPDATYTPQIAALLAQEGIAATFFLICDRLPGQEAVVAGLLAQGHQLGNHTMSHPHLPRLTAAAAEREVADCQALLAQYAPGPLPFRPPFGDIDGAGLALPSLQAAGATLWEVDSLDWAGAPAAFVAANVIAGFRPGAIILLHSGRQSANALAALPEILAAARAQGYRLVTVGELFAAAR